MIRLLTALTLALTAPTAPAAIDRPWQRYTYTTLSCVGGTFDVGASASGFTCTDENDHDYYGYTLGGGVGGLITVSYFKLYARTLKGRELSGQYSGPSFALALVFGVGGAFFARNAGNGWRPDFEAEEYMYSVGGHLGIAGDASVNTFYITRQ